MKLRKCFVVILTPRNAVRVRVRLSRRHVLHRDLVDLIERRAVLRHKHHLLSKNVNLTGCIRLLSQCDHVERLTGQRRGVRIRRCRVHRRRCGRRSTW